MPFRAWTQTRTITKRSKALLASAGVVTLLGAGVPAGVPGRGGPRSLLCAQAVVGRLVTPVICSQIAKRMVISVRWS